MIEDDWKIWRDKSRWPFAPSDYVFLAAAAEQICSATYKKRWLKPFDHMWTYTVPPPASKIYDVDGRIARSDLYQNHIHQIRAIGGFPPSYPIKEPTWDAAYKLACFNFEHADHIRRQRGEALTYLHRVFAEGLVKSCYKEVTSGKFKIFAPHAWNCEEFESQRRFRTCSIDLGNPFGIAGNRNSYTPAHLFVTFESLQLFLDVLSGATNTPANAKFGHQINELIQTVPALDADTGDPTENAPELVRRVPSSEKLDKWAENYKHVKIREIDAPFISQTWTEDIDERPTIPSAKEAIRKAKGNVKKGRPRGS